MFSRVLSSKIGENFKNKYHLFSEVLSMFACFEREVILVLTGHFRSAYVNTLDGEEFLWEDFADGDLDGCYPVD